VIHDRDKLQKQDGIFGKICFLIRPTVSLTLLILLFSSCAKIPTNRFIRTNPNIDKYLPQITTVGVVNDVCLLRDDVGDDYHSIEDSKLASSFMLQGAKAYLMEKKSYKVDFQLSPTVCAFKDSKEKMNVAQEKGTETFYENSPFFVSESVKNDRSYEQALIHLIKQVQKSVEQNEYSPYKLFSQDEKIRNSLKLIAERANIEVLLVITGNGVVVSTGKAIGQAVLTTVLTLGFVTAHNTSYLDSYAALIDLKKGEMLWSNSLRIKDDPTDEDFYLEEWPHQILYHFPPN
jgi:hypothetical protein